MGTRLSGHDIDAMVGDYTVQFEEVTLTIEDNSKAVMSRGRPNGHVRGSIKASGEFTVDSANLSVMMDAARSAGSFIELPPFDVVFNGETSEDTLRVEAFECLTKLSDVLNANANGEEKLTHKIPYEVTGKHFVRINGTPYAPESEISRLR